MPHLKHLKNAIVVLAGDDRNLSTCREEVEQIAEASAKVYFEPESVSYQREEIGNPP